MHRRRLQRLPPARLAREYALAAALAAACLLALIAATDLKTEGTAAFLDPGWDRHVYIEMATTNPLDFHLSPYGWRILVPTLEHILPSGLQPTFFAITFVSLLGAGVLMYALARRWFPPRVAILAVPAFASFGWAVKFNLADFWLVDPAAYLFLLATLVAACHRRFVAASVLMLVGVLAKESVIVAAPLAWSLNARGLRNWRTLRTAALVAAPAVVAFVLLRVLIPSRNTDADYIATLPPAISRFPELFPRYYYPSLLHDIGYEQRFQALGPDLLASYTYRSFTIVLLVFAAAALPRHWRLALRLAPLFLFAWAQTLVATDTERLVVLAFPAVVVLALAGVADIAAWLRVSPLWCAPAIVGVFALNLLDASAYGVPAWPQLALLATTAALLCAASLFARTPTPPPSHGEPGR